MSTKENKNVDQEIDLGSISRAISGLFQSIGRGAFLSIRFVLKRIVIFVILILLGAGIGFYLDHQRKTYDTLVIIRPNFETTDYVYAKIDLLISKIHEKDTAFLRSIGIKNPSQLKNIKIYPIIDIYKFISEKDSKEKDPNFQILKLLAEDSNLSDVIKDEVTAKNYTFHKIHFITSGIAGREEVLEPLLKFIGGDEYYQNVRQLFIQNTKLKIEANKIMIAQIDALLSTFTHENAESAKNNKAIFISENSQLNDIIQMKRELVDGIDYYERELLSHDKVVMESSTILNMQNTKSFNSKRVYLFPLFLIATYLLVFGLIKFYKNQALNYTKEKL